MPTNFIDFFKQRERGGTQNKKKEEENKKHKSNLTDICDLFLFWILWIFLLFSLFSYSRTKSGRIDVFLGLGSSELGQGARDTHLVVLPLGDPEVLLVLHDLGEHSSTEENHVLAARGILNADLEFLKARNTKKG